jgi:hypothetical protein
MTPREEWVSGDDARDFGVEAFDVALDLIYSIAPLI